MIDATSPTQEVLVDGNTKKVYGLGLISVETPTTKAFIHLDRLGSVIAAGDKFGYMVAHIKYDEWGSPTVLMAGLTPSYPGHEWDSTLGVYYAKARFYDAGDRRFTAKDPLKGNVGFPETMVQYLYCLNNPTGLIDPLGLAPNAVPAPAPTPARPAPNYTITSTTRTVSAVMLKRIKEEANFVTFTDTGNQGGHQGWFESKLDKPYKNDTGCASIAVANILMYYAQTNYGGVGSELYKNSNSITTRNFIDFAENIYDNYVPQEKVLLFNVGVWSMYTATDGLIKYAGEKGINLKMHEMDNLGIGDYKKAGAFIERGLTADAPVLMLVKYNNYAASLNTKANNYSMAEKHFVTIVGIEKNITTYEKKYKDNCKIETWEETDYKLHIATWGKIKQIPSLKKLWETQNPSTLLVGNVSLAYFTLN